MVVSIHKIVIKVFLNNGSGVIIIYGRMDKVSPRMADIVDLKPEIKRVNGGRGGPLNEHGLTLREENFCQKVAGGASYSDAYRHAYDASGMTPGTLWCRAWGVAHRGKVEQRVRRLTEEVAETEKVRGVRAKAFIEEKLWAEANDSKSKPTDRLKALELLGKMDHVGAFKERSEVVTEATTPEQIKSRIEELVRKTA